MKEKLKEKDVSEVIERIRNKRNALIKAKNLKCECDGFVLQYEGRCMCGRGEQITACKKALWDEIMSL